MTSDPSNPHDALVRKLLSDPADAGAEIRPALPKDIAEQLDWDCLERVDGSYVSAELRMRYSDLLLRTRIKSTGRQAFIYLLLEHQSTPDPLMAFRLLEYQVGIIRTHLRESGKKKVTRIPAVLSLVVHAGPKGLRWNAPMEVSELFDLDPAVHATMRDYLPRMRYFLDDVNSIDIPALMARPTTPRCRLTLALIKITGRGRRTLLLYLPSLIPDMLALLQGNHGPEDFRSVVTYIRSVGKLLPGELESLADQLGPTAKEIIVTTAEMLEARGEARGRMQGRAAMLLELLEDKFGTLTPDIEQTLHAADADQLKTWSKRVLHANTLDEVLA